MRWALKDFPQHHSLRYLKEHYPIKYIILHLSKYPKRKRSDILEDILQSPDELHIVTNFGNDYVIELDNRGEGEKIIREFPHYWLKGKNLQFTAKASIKLPAAKNILSVYLNGNLIKSFELTEHCKQFHLPIAISSFKYGINRFEFTSMTQEKVKIIVKDLELVQQ